MMIQQRMLQFPNTCISTLHFALWTVKFAICTVLCTLHCVVWTVHFSRQCNICSCSSHRSLWCVICSLHIYSISAVSPWPQILSRLLHRVQFVYKSHKMFGRLTRHSGRSLYWDIYTPTYRNHRGRKNWPNDDNPNHLIRSHCGRENSIHHHHHHRGTIESLASAPVNQICFWK